MKQNRFCRAFPRAVLCVLVVVVVVLVYQYDIGGTATVDTVRLVSQRVWCGVPYVCTAPELSCERLSCFGHVRSGPIVQYQHYCSSD